MLILVVNAGSSSLKYQLINMDDESVLAKGNCDRIGIDGHISHKTADGRTLEEEYSFPTHTEAFEKLIGRVHPGAIVLLHSTSATNAEILDELLTKWEEMGYTFKTLDDL